MKTLVFSDMHFHNWTYGSTLVERGIYHRPELSEAWNSRLLWQVDVCEQILESAEENNVTSIVFCGDLFHTPGKIDVHVLSAAANCLQVLSKFKIYLLVGNHDCASKNGSINSLNWWADRFGFVVQNIPHLDEHLGMAFLSYTEEPQLIKDAFNITPEDGILFMHQGVANLPVGSGFVVPNEILSEDMIPDHIKRVFTGHYHRPWDGDRISVVGSPMQHNWGDADTVPRGWLIYDHDTDTIERFESDAPKFLRLRILEDISDDEETPYENNYIKVTSEFRGDQDYLRKRLLDRGALSVEFELEKNNITNVMSDTPTLGFNLEKTADTHGKHHGANLNVGRAIRNKKYEIPKIGG